MYDIESIFERMRDAVAAGPVRVKELKDSGSPIVGIFCTFTPWELIHAAGAVPVSLCSTSEKPIAAAERHLPRNLCPLVKSSYGFALTDTCPYFHFCDMVVGETTCDGKKKMYEYLGELRQTHVMQLPQDSSHEMAAPLWKYEILRLKKALEDRFDVEITDKKLEESLKLRERIHKTMMDFYNLAKLPTPVVTGREIMLVADYLKLSFDYEAFIHEVSSLTRKLSDNYVAGERRVSPAAKRVLITGCPMGKSLEKVAAAIEADGNGVVIGFENCGNLKCLSRSADPKLSPIDALTEKYLHIACSVMSPNTERIKLLRRFCEEYRVDGVADVVLQACHTYAIEERAVREEMKKLDLPYIAVETDYSQSDAGQLSTRLSAFTEML